ncbi:ATP-dependent DNA ligase-like domain protein [Leptospira interrogans serovar Canicola]|nr:ATP-dependent DNA ligase-like domain protein [Leptospira interrogans serovar Canicola]
MNHKLIFRDDKSDKFWNIETSGNSFTVTYGKTGTAGTSQTKTFETEETCIKEARKLLSEKLKKRLYRRKR